MTYFWQNPVASASPAPSCGCRLPNDHTMADVQRLRDIYYRLDLVERAARRRLPRQLSEDLGQVVDDLITEINALARTARR